ncbi:NDP-hexose 2,3-dehydratase family protein [Candidatus Uhrbacteria bacterium]|nr:NDP-hexose 2,3-dehydratase family protein [Candidatus Uhrbacteria bacterium]
MMSEVHDTYAGAYDWLLRNAPRLAMQAEIGEFEEFPQTGQLVEDSEDPPSRWVVGTDAIGRPDGRFYRVVNVVTKVGSGREVTAWESPMVVDEGGYILLIVDNESGDVLVRAKAEPGNMGVVLKDGSQSRVLLSPPFQASMANMNAHGSRVPLIVIVRGFKEWELASEDGGRFFEKENQYGLMVTDRELIDHATARSSNPDDFIWVSRETLREARRRKLLNGHLRSAMSLLA